MTVVAPVRRVLASLALPAALAVGAIVVPAALPAQVPDSSRADTTRHDSAAVKLQEIEVVVYATCAGCAEQHDLAAGQR